MAIRIMTAPRIKSIEAIREVDTGVEMGEGAASVVLMEILSALDDEQSQTFRSRPDNNRLSTSAHLLFDLDRKSKPPSCLAKIARQGVHPLIGSLRGGRGLAHRG